MTEPQYDYDQLKGLFDTFYEDMPLFAKHVFNVTLTPKQIEYADAFKNNDTITVGGSSGWGKTFVSAISLWWSLIVFNPVKVTIFAPSESTIKSGIWNELQVLYAKMDPVFKDLFEVSATKIARKSGGETCWAEYRLVSKDNIAAARGFHSKNNIVIADEASGIEDVIFTGALLNVLNDDFAKVVLVSNPDKASGFFFRTWRDPELSQDWVKVHGTIRDKPNYKPGDEERFARLYGGVTSRDYLAMVEGEFPLSDVDGLISREFIEDAISNKEVVPDPKAPIIWGLDPAGAGKDKSVLCIRHDNVLRGFEEWQGLEPVALALRVKELYLNTAKINRPAVIAVDGNGLGAGVFDALKHFDIPVYKCMFAEVPKRKPDRYTRVRDQIWWEMREWIHTGDVSIPNHKKLVEDLAIPTYEDAPKIKIEDKKSLKKRLGRSPDYADALALTFSVSHTRYASKYQWDKPIEYDNLSQWE
ncbi:PhoH family protein [Sinorhizobium fredii]|uniref:PhoH family protein n=1 Tax=Rhizobium fredii TaxID=380 RepID=UPI0004B47633|nr:PhoH family protein [Sinorhizobium fredii]AWI60355.1 hypothetical protein AB395_00005178 [Sinorhizobium fredii CCBAU 45436]